VQDSLLAIMVLSGSTIGSLSWLPLFSIVVTTSCFYRGYYAFSAFPVTTRMRNHFEHLSFMKLHYQLASIMGDSDGDGCFIFSEMKGNKPQNYI
jgi:hypothetical protein